MTRIEKVVKRNGAIVPFNQDRITNAIYRAAVLEGKSVVALGSRGAAAADEIYQLIEEVIAP